MLTEIALYAVSALISFSLLNNLFKKLDPTNSEANAKQARLQRLAAAHVTLAVCSRARAGC